MFGPHRFIVILSILIATFSLQAQTSPTQPLLSEAVVLAPKAKAQFKQGREAFSSGNYDEAKKKFEGLYNIAPGNPDVNLSLGLSYLMLHQLEKATFYLSRANSLNPVSFRALTALAIVNLEKAEYGAAAEKADLAVERAPKKFLPHWVLAGAYLGQGRFQAALKQAQQALRLGKNTANGAKFIVGASLAEMGRKREARKELEEFLQENPQNPDVPTAQKIIMELESK